MRLDSKPIGRGFPEREASGGGRRTFAALCATAAAAVLPAAIALSVVILDPENKIVPADLWYAGLLVLVVAGILVAARALRLAKLRREAAVVLRAPLDAVPPRASGEAEEIWASLILAERKEAAGRLEASDAHLRAELDAYLASIHALKTPATTLALMAERSEREDSALPPGEVRAEVDELCHIIDRILGRIRLEDFEKGSIARSDVDVAEAVRASLRRHRRLFIARNVSVAIEGGCATDTDPGWLGFILDQALSNAGKYAVSEVMVRMGAVGGLAFIEIEDDGPGLSDYDAARLFGPSATGSAGREVPLSDGEGPDASGYGLYLARMAADRLGWRLALSPGKPNAGEAGRPGTLLRVEMPEATKLGKVWPGGGKLTIL